MSLLKTFKKILPIAFLSTNFLFLGIFSLKSTSFNRIYAPHKTIVAMNPIYSEGDPVPVVSAIQNNTMLHNNNSKIQNPSGSFKPKIYYVASLPPREIASNNPISIIPNYTHQRKTFYRPYIQTVNAYIKPKTDDTNQNNVAFQAKIPQQNNSLKHLRPVAKYPVVAQGRTSYTIPLYKEYASIRR